METRLARIRFRRWAGRALVAVLVPSLAVGLLELGLRLAGYGTDASYFQVTEWGERRVVGSNQAFTRRFLPVGMDRLPMPVEVDAVKAPDVVRVVVIGSSAALGDPEPAFGIGRHLDVLLHARYPGRRFEVINTGLTGVNSHVTREVAADLADVAPDLVIVYTGNNEVVGPWGPGAAVTSAEPPLWVIRARTLLLATRTGQLVRAAADAIGRAISGEPDLQLWGGMRMFLDRQVAADDPRLPRVRDHFRANLEAIVASARAAGAEVVVCSLPANLRDCAPFASRSSLAGAAGMAFQSALDAGDSAYARADTAAALVSRPDDPYLLERLAGAWVIFSDPRRGIRPLERLVTVWPGYENARVNLAVALAQSGRPDEAESLLRQAVADFPGGQVAPDALSDFLLNHRREREAVEVLRAAPREGPLGVAMTLRLARILATSADPTLRDGEEAVRLAERAVAAGRGHNLAAMEILAAAHAAAGAFPRAAELQQRILAAAEEQGMTERIPEMRRRLQRYREGRTAE